jgi:hypothetical protein
MYLIRAKMCVKKAKNNIIIFFAKIIKFSKHAKHVLAMSVRLNDRITHWY